jgi:hypothetical protein
MRKEAVTDPQPGDGFRHFASAMYTNAQANMTVHALQPATIQCCRVTVRYCLTCCISAKLDCIDSSKIRFSA